MDYSMQALKQNFTFHNFITKYHKPLLFLIFFIGFIARFYHLSSLPLGVNQDEAYAGYEAYSLLHYGVDSHGYTNPVYFISWGSGMNVLYSYLTIPFLFFSGNHLNSFIIRLPQAVFSCVSLIAFYFLVKKIYADKTKALLGVFILAVTPWHIMLAHWGLESNIAPAFLLFGLLFWMKGVENSKFFLLSALFYGISLYAYAPLWFAVPVILGLQFIYLFICKRIKWDKYFILSIILLFLLALPLILFLLVNKGILPEIRTAFFSIPKLLEFRGGEFSIHNLKTSIYNFYSLFATQNDGLVWNSTVDFGFYYKFSTIFILIGVCSLIYKVIVSLRKRHYQPVTFLLINTLVGTLFGCLISYINVNKINMLHIPLLFCCIEGILTATSFFKRNITVYIVALYTVCFVAFLSFYFYSFNNLIQEPFQYGVVDSVKAAMKKENSTIYVNSDIFYSTVLFASKTPVTNYLETVKYNPDLPGDSTPVSFTQFIFGYNKKKLTKDSIYIIPNEEASLFLENGFTIDDYGNYCVAYSTNE